MGEEDKFNRPHQEMGQLSFDEKKFLLAVERGDVATVRRMLLRSKEIGNININCVDPLGRSALLMAIDNENLEMVELLIEFKVETKDALLHAINEEYVEAVEVLLDHEETIHLEGKLHSWEAVPQETATFTPDITPLILAAHRDNYEIIKILLDRGGKLPTPHELRCGCDECVTSRREDSLRHSRSRINAYRALASPSLIALSSKDPILTAFELSWELRRLSFLEHEFRSEYQELRKQCQDFATALLDHTRSSFELEVLLNHDPTGPPHEYGERMQLNRLKLAIKLKQKKFVAHPNVQQLLASMWYEGLPGFRRKNIVLQALQIVKIGILFPFFSIVYILAPHTSLGQTMRKPFIKFICHSASYFTFLLLLILASQRIEAVVSNWFESHPILKNFVATNVTTRRGAPPSLVEWLILAWVFGLIWSEIKQLWDVGLREYVHDMWNVLDFITNALYVATIALRIVAYHQVQLTPEIKMLERKNWDTWDPMLIAEGLFAAANIFSSLKLVYIFSVNPYLGPLQVSLSRMIVDILKFAFLYLLTLFAFSCGMNQLLWFYSDLEKQACIEITDMGSNEPERESSECIVWRRFSNLFETTQTLFWAAFGLIDLQNFELEGIKPFTRFWGMLMFGTYSVINVIVLLNLLIAMMNHSYQLVSVSSERADIEWKFARSKLWISYFEEGETAPPPFNIIIAPKSIYYLFRWFYRKFCGRTRKAKKEHMKTIRSIMRNLVRRYVTVEQRKAENQGVTEDDVNEIKQDISAFRCELIEILKTSGMNTSTAASAGQGSGGKKNRQKERRLMKGFNIGINSTNPTFNLAAPATVLPAATMQEVSEVAKRSPVNKLARLARLAEARLGRPSNKKRWGTLVEAAKNANVKKLLSRSRSDESLSSENANDNSGEPDDKSSTTLSVEEATQTTPLVGILRAYSEESKRKEGNGKSSISPNSSALPLDPSTLATQHKSVKSFVSRVRSKKNKSAVSFEYPIEEANEDSDDIRESISSPGELTLPECENEEEYEEKRIRKNSFELQSYAKSPSAESDSSVESSKKNSTSNSPRLERCSISTSSIKVLKSPPLSEIQLLASSKQGRVTTPDASSGTETSSSSSSRTSSANTTYPVVSHSSSELKIGHVASNQSESANIDSATEKTFYEPRHLPGIQPISRNMSAGWL